MTADATGLFDGSLVELRAGAMAGHVATMKALSDQGAFFTGLLQTAALKMTTELDAVEGASNERLLNAPARPANPQPG
jgi:hypothetical protein